MRHSKELRSFGPEWAIYHEIGDLPGNRGLPRQNEALTSKFGLYPVFNAPFGKIAVIRTRMGH